MFQILCKQSCVRVVQSGVDFVQHAERHRTHLDNRKQDSDCDKRLLAARIGRNVEHAFSRGLRVDFDARFQRISVGIFHDFQLRAATAEQRRERFFEVFVDFVESVGESRRHLGRQIFDDFDKVGFAFFDVFALRLFVFKAFRHFLIFFDCVRVDVAQSVNRLFQAADILLRVLDFKFFVLEFKRGLISQLVLFPDMLVQIFDFVVGLFQPVFFLKAFFFKVVNGFVERIALAVDNGNFLVR